MRIENISGYCGEYKIREDGTVLHYCKRKSGEIQIKTLSQFVTAGYLSVALKGKTVYVHRLLAQAFIKNPRDCDCVNHIDGVKTNNTIQNLEWCTKGENNTHAWKSGLQDAHKVACRRIEDGKVYESLRAAAYENCTSPKRSCNISRACKYGKTAGGYHWEFVKESEEE